MSVFAYFKVRDTRDIRASKRFQEEILPQFEGEVFFTVENQGKDIQVFGVHKDDAADPSRANHRCALTLSCDPDRPYLGRWVRSNTVY